MAAPGPSGDLEALLDDALEGFDLPAAARSQAAPPPAAAAELPPPSAAPPTEASAAQATPPPASASAPAAAGSSGSAAPAASASSSQPSTSGGAPKGLGFDPLARRPGKGGAGGAAAGPRRAPPAQPEAAGDAGDEAGGEEDLPGSLRQLLEELAQVEEALGQAAAGAGAAGAPPSAGASAAAGEAGASAAAAAAASGQQQRSLDATLRALSEQAPSFAGAGDQAGGEEEMLRLLAEHLGALGGGPSGPAEGGEGATGASGEGLEGAPGMASLVSTIMQQLLSKDVLYQPMKDIGGRYPEWLAANKDKLSAEEYARYERQHGFIQRICALYEAGPSDFAQLVDLLQQMQQCGQPPQEIVDELAPGMQFGPDGLPTFGGGEGEEGLPPELKDCSIM